MNDLQEYKEAAIMRAIKRIPGKVLNDGIAYANILIETMIGLCPEDDEVSIYSGQLPEESYVVALRTTPANKITVIIDDDTCIQWLSSLPNKVLSKITLYKIRRPRPNHFFFTSSGAFRLERDKECFTAEGDFNKPSALKELQGAFNVLLRDSDVIQTPSHASIPKCDTSKIGT